jgi:hypothetical protein
MSLSLIFEYFTRIDGLDVEKEISDAGKGGKKETVESGKSLDAFQIFNENSKSEKNGESHTRNISCDFMADLLLLLPFTSL